MLPPLYPILDASLLPAAGELRRTRLESLADDLLAAGVTLLQYRNKLGDEAEVLADAEILRAAMPKERCLLILNDFPSLVGKAGFDGVHVGQQDMHPEQARAAIGPERILGVSTHNPEQLAAAGMTSADYLAIGPVYATVTKANPDPVVGLEGVRRARALIGKPLVAIGGITLANCREVLDAGADSVAVISSLFAGGAGARASVEPTGKIARDFFTKLR